METNLQRVYWCVSNSQSITLICIIYFCTTHKRHLASNKQRNTKHRKQQHHRAHCVSVFALKFVYKVPLIVILTVISFSVRSNNKYERVCAYLQLFCVSVTLVYIIVICCEKYIMYKYEKKLNPIHFLIKLTVYMAFMERVRVFVCGYVFRRVCVFVLSW